MTKKNQRNHPLIIVGNPRSGTSLIRLMLTCHRNIFIPPECPLIYQLEPEFRDADFRQKSTILEFVDQLGQVYKIDTLELDFDAIRSEMLLGKTESYRDAIELVYKQLGGPNLLNSEKRWGDKSGSPTIKGLDRLAPHFADAFIIYIVRDGRDVAASYKAIQGLDGKYAPNLPRDVQTIANLWFSNNRDIMHFLTSWPKNQQYLLRYEDLVTDPKCVLEDLCAKIDEPFDVQMLKFHQQNKKMNLEPQEYLSWKEKTLEAVSSSQVNRFRDDLTSKEIQTFELLSHQMLKAHGYTLAEKLNWSLIVSDFSLVKIFLKRLHDKYCPAIVSKVWRRARQKLRAKR